MIRKDNISPDPKATLKRRMMIPITIMIQINTLITKMCIRDRVEMAAPGMTKDDFKVNVDENNNLTICMEKKEEKKEEKKDKKYLRREFSYSKFQQTILLPENVEKDKISAKVEHGILSIEIPKVKEEEKQKTYKAIEVK